MSETPEQEVARMGYDLSSLREHIEKRKVNIRVFEQAIQTERDGIELDQRMIHHLEEQVRNGDSN